MAQLKHSKSYNGRPKEKPVQPTSCGVSFPSQRGQPATAAERAALHSQDCKKRGPFRHAAYVVPYDALSPKVVQDGRSRSYSVLLTANMD